MPDKKNVINQKELIEMISSQVNIDLSKKQIEKTIKTLITIIIEQLKQSKIIKLTSFGTFTVKNRYARGGVDPRNPEKRIKIPAVKVAKFKTGKKLKDALKK
ncbi:MAG: HU family DNA-binding protein [Candidatus Colwellbacteria bacterium]|nr:HU family DNA-binding protein [Candidatus Colwellbacteria bacterium]